MQKLFDHQIKFLSENPDKTALVWSCGTSKTRTALEWSKLGNGKTLAIVPKSLVTNWKREMEKWGVSIDVMSKETFRRDHKKLPKYGQVICDEIHSGFLTPHFRSQMSKSLKWYLNSHEVKRFMGCSATVYTSSPWNIYQLATLLGYKWDWMSFSFKYFNQIRMGPRIIPVAKPGVEAMLAEEVKKIASVVNIYDCMDVPLQHHSDPEYFALTPKQERAIENAYDPLPIVRYTMQHEIENGVLLGNEFREAQVYENDKIERIKAICEENKKVAIVCRYNDQIDEIERALSSSKKNVLVIRGDVKDRDSITRQAEAAEEVIVLIQADCAEGYQLPSFGVCVFASMSYSYVKWEQICGRFLRMDKPSPTTFLYLVTEGESIDQAVYDAIKRKEDFKIALFKK